MADQKKAYAYGLVTVLLWSTVASAFKLSLKYLSTTELLLWSSIISTLVLAAILAARGRLSSALRISPRHLRLSLLYGFLNPFLYYLILFQAYDRLPAQEAQPLNYTWAVTLSLLSVPLLGHRLRRADLLALLVSYAGVVVISTRGSLGFTFADPMGVACALGSTVIWALYWILNTKDDREPVTGLFWNFLAGVPFILAWGVLVTGLRLPTLPGLAGAAYVGVFEMGVTFVTWLTALKYAESAAKVGTLIFLSPFLSLIFISTFVGEAILPSTYLGLCLIIGGLAVQRLGSKPEAKPA